MKEQKQEKKKFQKWPIVVLVLLIVLVIGATFAWLTLQLTGTKVNTIKAGSLNMVLDDETSDGILLQKAIPMSYQEGMKTTNYEFTLTNNGSKSDYTISLIDEATYTDGDVQVTIEDTNRIADTKIRYILLKDGEVTDASKSMLLSEAENRVIDSGTIESGTTITYSLRIWIDSKAENEVMGQIFNARLQLNATQHQEQVTPVFAPTYFAFGNFTNTLGMKAASTTDYTALGRNVFLTLYSDETTGGVCIIDGELFCLQTNDYDNSVAALKAHFGESHCSQTTNYYSCTSDDFHCTAFLYGGINCYDSLNSKSCDANADGSFSSYGN